MKNRLEDLHNHLFAQPEHNLTSELIDSAMFRSLEGFAVLVVDSLEFELKRELTSEEHQAVFHYVESCIDSTVPDEPEVRTVVVLDPFYPDGDLDYPLAVHVSAVKAACASAGVKCVIEGGG
ncbi:hypothetical protein EJH27_01645 [Salmonella enterica subsp. enterica serovar Virchow]|nr:hypothetical protein [Salmonella enterica subsp. enterica serovar Virchow]